MEPFDTSGFTLTTGANFLHNIMMYTLYCVAIIIMDGLFFA